MTLVEFLNRWFDAHPVDKLIEACRLAEREIQAIDDEIDYLITRGEAEV